MGAGDVYLFNVGEELNEKNSDLEFPRWEYFLGDRPHHDNVNSAMRQIPHLEDHAIAGEIVVSPEVIAVCCVGQVARLCYKVITLSSGQQIKA